MPHRLSVAALSIALIAGCTGTAPPPLDPEARAVRDRVLLSEAPSGAVGVVELRERLEQLDAPPAADGNGDAPSDAPEEDAPQEIVALAGTVGGIPNPWGDSYASFPFEDGKAIFIVADPEAAAAAAQTGHDHAEDEECLFCARAKRKAIERSLAMVQLVDDDGTPLAHDARRLFELAGGEQVVVRGRARLTELGILQLTADGIFVRR